MTNTIRWYGVRGYNPYYYRHEIKKVRIDTHRVNRHANRQNCKIFLKKRGNLEYIKFQNTRGWTTW